MRNTTGNQAGKVNRKTMSTKTYVTVIPENETTQNDSDIIAKHEYRQYYTTRTQQNAARIKIRRINTGIKKASTHPKALYNDESKQCRR